MPGPGQSSVLLVAITGGSGAGKSWLADRLAIGLRGEAVRLSLDDFYRDRSHLSAARRARINFDNPQAMDWREVERVVADLATGKSSQAPVYSFQTHTRLTRPQFIAAKPVVIMEGLWLLRRRALRSLFSLRIFIECPTRIRLSRRLARDVVSRKRSRKSITDQFRATVEPMHCKYVNGQQRWADVIIRSKADLQTVESLLNRIRQLRSQASIVDDSVKSPGAD